MQTLTVDLAERTYPILISDRLEHSLAALVDKMTRVDQINGVPQGMGQQIMVVSNAAIAELYLESVMRALSPLNLQIDTVLIPEGEVHKTFATVEHIIGALIEKGHDRHTTLIALGGGVTGDIVGFAAASYQRGVRFIQIPTTLLAQVDSSVGGKTGVNHPLGKNMIGAFHQPQAVLIGLDVLKTLPEREYRAGLAEVLKYGLIYDANFWDWLESNLDALMVHEPSVLAEAIYRSCVIKAAVVAADEKEKGLRAILNLGHTFGHALETGLGYGTMLHGEAVAVGMLMAVDLSYRLGKVPQALVERTESVLSALGLPVDFSASLSVAEVVELMYRDKKTYNKQLRLVLLKACGEAYVSSEFDEGVMKEVVSRYQCKEPC